MLLHHEVCAERSLHDNQYRAEKKKIFGHFKVDPYVMPNSQNFFTGSRGLLVCTLFVSNPETPTRSTARDTAQYTH